MRTRETSLYGWEPIEGQWTVSAALALTKGCEATPAPKFQSAGLYVAFCRRTRPEVFGTRPKDLDGRLIAAAWNRVSPTRWALLLPTFLRYWAAAATRPDIVGSVFNPKPELMLAAMLAGVPASIAGSLKERLLDRSKRVRNWTALKAGGRRKLTYAALALRRASLSGHERGERLAKRLDLGALAALGRLCPEGQAYVIDHCPEEWFGFDTETWPRVRVRDLIPYLDEAKPILRALASSDRVRLALAARDFVGASTNGAALGGDGCITGRLRQLLDPGKSLFEAQLPSKLVQRIAPAYPTVPMAIARKLCLGESPRQISGGFLTAREAHQWLESGGGDVAEWLQQALLGGMAEIPALRDPAIVRWLAAVKRREAWGQLTKERPLHLPGGEEATWRMIDRIDEIQVGDLARGERTRVEDAFESAAQRLGGRWAEMARKDHRVLAPLPKGWRLYKCMRHLNTPSLLEREGREMNHCVGGYTAAIEEGKCVVIALHLPKKGVRSTVELSPTGRVLQHRGAWNGAPHEALQRVLSRFVARRIGA